MKTDRQTNILSSPSVKRTQARCYACGTLRNKNEFEYITHSTHRPPIEPDFISNGSGSWFSLWATRPNSSQADSYGIVKQYYRCVDPWFGACWTYIQRQSEHLESPQLSTIEVQTPAALSLDICSRIQAFESSVSKAQSKTQKGWTTNDAKHLQRLRIPEKNKQIRDNLSKMNLARAFEDAERCG